MNIRAPKYNRRAQRRQRGFTLIELMTVITIIGILTAISIAGFSTSATDNARALALNTIVTKMYNQWIYTAGGLGTSSSITHAEANVLAGGQTVLGLLMDNDRADVIPDVVGVTQYQSLFDALGTRSLSYLGDWDSATGKFIAEKVYGIEIDDEDPLGGQPTTTSFGHPFGRIVFTVKNVPAAIGEIFQDEFERGTVLFSDLGSAGVAYTTGTTTGTVPTVAAVAVGNDSNTMYVFFTP